MLERKNLERVDFPRTENFLTVTEALTLKTPAINVNEKSAIIVKKKEISYKKYHLRP